MMFPIHWLITTIIWITCWLPFYFIGFFVTWIGLLFCNKDSIHMPKLWWLWDNSHGINGTINDNNGNWVIICNNGINATPEEKRKILAHCFSTNLGLERTYRNRWIWITWRNPVSNLSMYLMGLKINKPVEYYSKSFGPFKFEKATSGRGWFYAFTLKYNNARGFFYAIGWKFLDPAEGRARFMYRISPFRALM